MSTYKVVITNIGLTKIKQAIAAGTNIVVTHMAYGDAYGVPYTPVPSQTSLHHEVIRKELTSREVVDGMVKYTSALTATDTTGVYIELGLIDEDDELFAVANIPTLEHTPQEEGSITEAQVSIVLDASNASVVEIAIPSEIYVSRTYADSNYIRTDGTNHPTEDVSMNSNKITELSEGLEITDAASVSQVLPPGSIVLWSGSVTLNKWLDADGSAISRTENAQLFATIGTLYGEGDGTTTFNLPDLSETSFPSPMRYVIKKEY